MIKDIVVNLTIGVDRDSAANYAVSLANIFKAHLVGIAFVYDPKISANLMVGIPAELVDAQRAANRHLANEATARFEAIAKQAGVTTESQVIDVAVGKVGNTFGRLARSFDLSVIRQAVSDDAEEISIIEGALFESGRPVIVVPHVHTKDAEFKRVMVGWDGSRTAARAIGDAMPLLECAKMIEIFTMVTGPTNNVKSTGIDNIGQHLSRHGLNVEVKRIRAVDMGVSDAILSHAADISADFMIMGGYGHSRLGEYMLGGAARGILASMTLPTLMSN